MTFVWWKLAILAPDSYQIRFALHFPDNLHQYCETIYAYEEHK